MPEIQSKLLKRGVFTVNVIVSFVSATSNVVFPGVGGLGHLPRPLPHQAAEHLPGSGEPARR